MIMKFQRNVLLKDHTTFQIGGRAKYFFIAKNNNELILAIQMAKKKKLPFFILGGGSNLLVSDNGFKGLVIKLQITNYKLQTNSKSKIQKIYVEAGTFLNQLINFSVKNKLTGLEWAAGIPGTIGGAIRGNAGAFEKEMKDIIKTVTVLEISNSKSQITNKFQIPNSKFKTKIFNKKDCQFEYRNSIFKNNPNLIIISAELQLKKGDKKNIQEKIKEYLDYRKKNHPLNYPSAGSIFKNPLGFSVGRLKRGEPRPFGAGQLIEQCGLKGKKFGNVQISEKHCNFIINLGKGKAKDVIFLIKLIKQKVKKKFKINLKEEVQFLGKF